MKVVEESLFPLGNRRQKWWHKLFSPFSSDQVFPEIDYELEQYKSLLKGKVLNAGAGWRDVKRFVEGELINQDIRWDNDERTHIDIYSSLHEIPLEDNSFDAILCIAVIEHVENPEKVISELFRVLKFGGYLILSVPFLQPEHKMPTDFQRYTKDGLISLVSRNRFHVKEIRTLFTAYHTMYWIVWEWLHIKTTIPYVILRYILLPLLIVLCKFSSTSSEKLASGFQLVVVKETSIGLSEYEGSCT